MSHPLIETLLFITPLHLKPCKELEQAEERLKKLLELKRSRSSFSTVIRLQEHAKS